MESHQLNQANGTAQFTESKIINVYELKKYKKKFSL